MQFLMLSRSALRASWWSIYLTRHRSFTGKVSIVSVSNSARKRVIYLPISRNKSEDPSSRSKEAINKLMQSMKIFNEIKESKGKKMTGVQSSNKGNPETLRKEQPAIPVTELSNDFYSKKLDEKINKIRQNPPIDNSIRLRRGGTIKPGENAFIESPSAKPKPPPETIKAAFRNLPGKVPITATDEKKAALKGIVQLEERKVGWEKPTRGPYPVRVFEKKAILFKEDTTHKSTQPENIKVNGVTKLADRVEKITINSTQVKDDPYCRFQELLERSDPKNKLKCLKEDPALSLKHNLAAKANPKQLEKRTVEFDKYSTYTVEKYKKYRLEKNKSDPKLYESPEKKLQHEDPACEFLKVLGGKALKISESLFSKKDPKHMGVEEIKKIDAIAKMATTSTATNGGKTNQKSKETFVNKNTILETRKIKYIKNKINKISAYYGKPKSDEITYVRTSDTNVKLKEKINTQIEEVKTGKKLLDEGNVKIEPTHSVAALAVVDKQVEKKPEILETSLPQVKNDTPIPFPINTVATPSPNDVQQLEKDTPGLQGVDHSAVSSIPRPRSSYWSEDQRRKDDTDRADITNIYASLVVAQQNAIGTQPTRPPDKEDERQVRNIAEVVKIHSSQRNWNLKQKKTQEHWQDNTAGQSTKLKIRYPPRNKLIQALPWKGSEEVKMNSVCVEPEEAPQQDVYKRPSGACQQTTGMALPSGEKHLNVGVVLQHPEENKELDFNTSINYPPERIPQMETPESVQNAVNECPKKLESPTPLPPPQPPLLPAPCSCSAHTPVTTQDCNLPAIQETYTCEPQQTEETCVQCPCSSYPTLPGVVTKPQPTHSTGEYFDYDPEITSQDNHEHTEQSTVALVNKAMCMPPKIKVKKNSMPTPTSNLLQEERRRHVTAEEIYEAQANEAVLKLRSSVGKSKEPNIGKSAETPIKKEYQRNLGDQGDKKLAGFESFKKPGSDYKSVHTHMHSERESSRKILNSLLSYPSSLVEQMQPRRSIKYRVTKQQQKPGETTQQSKQAENDEGENEKKEDFECKTTVERVLERRSQLFKKHGNKDQTNRIENLRERIKVMRESYTNEQKLKREERRLYDNMIRCQASSNKGVINQVMEQVLYKRKDDSDKKPQTDEKHKEENRMNIKLIGKTIEDTKKDEAVRAKKILKTEKKNQVQIIPTQSMNLETSCRDPKESVYVRHVPEKYIKPAKVYALNAEKVITTNREPIKEVDHNPSKTDEDSEDDETETVAEEKDREMKVQPGKVCAKNQPSKHAKSDKEEILEEETEIEDSDYIIEKAKEVHVRDKKDDIPQKVVYIEKHLLSIKETDQKEKLFDSEDEIPDCTFLESDQKKDEERLTFKGDNIPVSAESVQPERKESEKIPLPLLAEKAAKSKPDVVQTSVEIGDVLPKQNSLGQKVFFMIHSKPCYECMLGETNFKPLYKKPENSKTGDQIMDVMNVPKKENVKQKENVEKFADIPKPKE